jgi:hypothetical protein
MRVQQGRGRGLEIHTLYTPRVAKGMTKHAKHYHIW